ncbi:hypothetical protein GYMLUDRAFT_71444 [Collybiopsis luxurians FD-317 M1]|uniref:Uncharacterized protein n=1 Tax=Collybiopsis luxurians FD-317 M1 TaxID=944289 RepID=A0A0D0C744_9AGAR|nr:hypothetical protein GYMLUDRAFT_71444 [Collybiopsis luxurians FD-317 M1]
MPESSPVAAHSARPLKRSASMASLPTPPRTSRRTKNRKLRSLKAATAEEEREADGSASSDDEQEESGEPKYKKRRISSAQEETQDNEAAFWLAGSLSSGKETVEEPTTVDAVDSDSDSETTTSFLSRRAQKSSTVGSAPVSPPPSHRRPAGAKIAPTLNLLPAVEENPSPAGTSPPETPKSSKMRAFRDSPDNPFLASPLDLDAAASTSLSSKELPKLEEKPTMTYVFRGVKKTYPNPYYDHEKDRPRSPDPNSRLSPEHPDFSPDLRGAPRALWPRKKKVSPSLAPPDSPSNRAHRRKAARPVPSLASSEDELDSKEDDEQEKISLRPVRLFDQSGHGRRLTSRS